jgi:hypothetical protein
MAKTATYAKIASTTLGSAVNSYTFTSIPSIYTDLIIIGSVSSANTDDVKIRFNSDTGSNYSSTNIYGTGSTAASARRTNETAATIGFYATGMGTNNSPMIINVMDYANTTTYKTAISRSGRADGDTEAIVGLWRSTAAISSLTLLVNNSNNFATGSIFTLYGIEDAK